MMAFLLFLLHKLLIAANVLRSDTFTVLPHLEDLVASLETSSGMWGDGGIYQSL